MPVRRPGGKYRGLIARNKTDADLIKEARERLRRTTEAAIRRGKARSRRAKDPLGSNGKLQKSAQETWEEEKQQRILSMLMGGKRGNLKKFFMAWLAGLEVQLKESLIQEREMAWQKACAPEGSRCTAARRLISTHLELPFEAMKSGAVGPTSAWGLDSPSSLPRRVLEAMTGVLPRPQSMNSIQDAFWRGSAQKEASPKRAWLTAPPDTVVHYKSGRKYKLDPLSMRIAPLRVANVSAAGSRNNSPRAQEKPKEPRQLHFETFQRPSKEAWASVV
ncbi:unnamed protein product [Effrenium voratum]|nr:unnamed protein product [Effrenium voratum]